MLVDIEDDRVSLPLWDRDRDDLVGESAGGDCRGRARLTLGGEGVLSLPGRVVAPMPIVHSGVNFGFGKRHPSTVSAIDGWPRWYATDGLSITNGERLMLSTPPAMKTSPSPAEIAWNAESTVCMPEPHKRFRVCPGTVTGRPASRSAILATFRLSSPAWLM